MRPNHQLCLEHVCLQIVRGRLLIRQWTDPQYLLSLRVDDLVCHIARDDQANVRARVEGLTYADLPSIFPMGRNVIHQKARTSLAQVYRTKGGSGRSTLEGS